ncbi:uncharacterized protein Z520_03485 [Fonsecaea multimorphosa CBS 102226]|uniref:DOMON domain-containing protein n=1 Tax=Fonsecaea multimorphosa CBS 102226 TaxID=1442371 RepID=A0A0D2KVN8_9EURO|nr:uncharacterized protein Z520_03485 [Fonsecaea multimorphosa CBS 102226]KIY00819.1 hypothetical protein Z520_03485 [Fonsecaea multimorphosa CBS 102226]OAL27918.1 hypothetical protein AYO22_03263 [Fonsecaea multimorphosa]
MVQKSVLATAALVAGSAAQFAQFASNDYALAVNVPSDTASSGSGSLFWQISAPSGTQWVAFGQGSAMAGANMMVVYAADSNNVTVSPRLGTGHVQPKFNSDASISVLEGSGIASDGSLVANIRCDSCLSWSGGSMSPTDSSSSWIFAFKTGDALDSTDTSATITQHDTEGTFSLDLTQGTGGSSSNPFVAASSGSSSSSSSSSSAASSSAASSSAASSATPSASGSQTTSASPATTTESGTATASTVVTPTGGVSNPIVSSNPSSSSGTVVSDDSDDNIRTAHAVIMPLVFVVMFPLAALTLYLPYSNKVRHIHAPLQVLSLILMIVGLGLGVQLGKQVDNLDGYHMVIGYILVAWMGVFQPTLGLLQHIHFRRYGTRSAYGQTHRWLGRAMIMLGVINGGLGFKTAGNIGSDDVPTYSVAVYSVFAVVVFIIYLVVLFFPRDSQSPQSSLSGEKPRPRIDGYEMHGRSSDGARPLRG